jgi:hypothetical protein
MKRAVFKAGLRVDLLVFKNIGEKGTATIRHRQGHEVMRDPATHKTALNERL